MLSWDFVSKTSIDQRIHVFTETTPVNAGKLT